MGSATLHKTLTYSEDRAFDSVPNRNYHLNMLERIEGGQDMFDPETFGTVDYIP